MSYLSRRSPRLIIALLLSLSAPLALAEALDEARPGDLIFRKGTAPVSGAVMALEMGMEDDTFSHVGMLARQDHQWVVIHSTPSETPDRIDGVNVDPLSFFTDPEHAQHTAIYQVNATTAERQRAVGWATAKVGTPFRVFGDDALYCTTLVWQAWQSAGVELEPRFTHMTIPLAEGDYLLPSGLMASPRLSLIAE